MGKIQLIRGAFHPHLENRLFEDIVAARETPLDPVVVLVGSNLLANYLSRRFAAWLSEKHETSGHIGVRFLTFRGISLELA